ncbi:MAG: hypothetical protein ACK5VR_12135 [Burkholderiales bacterium]
MRQRDYRVRRADHATDVMGEENGHLGSVARPLARGHSCRGISIGATSGGVVGIERLHTRTV